MLTALFCRGQFVFWHSSAHILGEACERRFGCSLCIGPPVDNGFYYEMALPNNAAVSDADFKPLETIVGSIVKEKQKFERLEMSKEHLLEMVRSDVSDMSNKSPPANGRHSLPTTSTSST